MGFSLKQTRALRRNLDPRFIRTRKSAGRELCYIEGWHAIAEANRIFGTERWDRETVEARCVLAREVRGSFTAAYIAKVRITVHSADDHVVREGHGTGEGQGGSIGEAHETAIKMAETDATKRALATFGRPFGLGLYLSAGAPRQNGAHKTPARPAQAASPPAPARGSSPGSRPPADNDARPDSAIPPGPVREAPSVSQPTEGDDARSADGSLAGPAAQIESAFQSTATHGTQQPPLASGKARLDGGPATRPDVHSRGKIDKSQLTFGEPRRLRDRNHLRFVASQPCLLCGRNPSDPHHLRFAQPVAIGSKVSDEFTVPLCRTHHRQLHQARNELAWWDDLEVDPLPIARDLWQESRRKRGINDNQPPMTAPKQATDAASDPPGGASPSSTGTSPQ